MTTTKKTTYDAIVGSWNGACYELYDRVTLDAETLEEAIEEVKEATWCDADEDYDIRVEIADEDGNTVHSETFENSVAKNKQEEMDESWSSCGEFSTLHCGVKDGQWYTWSTNGGSRGAHDRMDGSGRWIERYDEPDEVEPSEALEWLYRHTDMDTDEALDAMADADDDRDKSDLVEEIGDCLWSGDRRVGVYRVRGNLYTVDGSVVELVDIDEAADFVDDNDGDSSEVDWS